MIARILHFLLIPPLLLAGCNPGPLAGTPAALQTAASDTANLPPTQTAVSTPSRTLPPAVPTNPVPTAAAVTVTASPTPILLPPIGRGSSFAFDREKGEVLVFGGSLSGSPGAENETWAWDGHAWKQYHPKTSPPARVGDAMVYDAAQKQVVLFGGSQLNGPAFGDMWVWDGENWTEQKPPQLPSPRVQPKMVYDTARNEIFLFGGYMFDENFNMHYFNETWIYDGQTWTKQNPAHTPRGSDGVPHPILTYDAAQKQPVLVEFGVGTWIWNGSDWNRLAAAGALPIDIEGSLSYDEKNQLVILWGRDRLKGQESPPETWLFDGHNWSQAIASQPGPDSPEATILYDSQQQRLLMFAFVGEKMIPASISIWEWSNAGWRTANQP